MRFPKVVLWGALLLPLAGCDSLLTEAPDPSEVFDGPIDGLTPAQVAVHIAGDEAFSDLFTPDRGLGPIFNQAACVSCHPGDGRGHPSTNLRRFGRIGEGVFDYMTERGGPQLQDRAIPGYMPEVLPSGITGLSERGGPIVVGLGLIEAIPDDVILGREDPGDQDGDGISGRASFVAYPEYLTPDPGRVTRFGRYLGRFGRKATAVNLLQQTAGAYLNDMGVTSDYLPEDLYHWEIGPMSGDAADDPEVPARTVADVVFYLQTLRPPERRNVEDPEVIRGEGLFADVGCARCHTPVMETGPHPLAPLSRKPVRLYSDLLLHDMGPALADDFPEGDASGSEWRTTPLWGLGIVENVLGGTPYYLHDGRTSDLMEAIDLHGGEAEGVVAAFLSLSAEERRAVLAFLKSL